MDGLSLIFFITVLIIYIVIAHFTGKIADQKGYSYGGFFLFSLIVPLIALLIASFLSVSSDSSNNKKCPYCAEYVKKEAVICKHCKKELPTNKEKKEGGTEDLVYKEEDKNISKAIVFILVLFVLIFAAVAIYLSLNKQKKLSKPERIKVCVEQRIKFFKSVNSYPVLNYSRDKGKATELVAKEQCRRQNNL